MIYAIALMLANSMGTSGSGDSAVTYSVGGQSFMLPPYDEVDVTWYGATNNMETRTFSREGVPVAKLEYTYVGNGAANDDRISNISRVAP